MLSTLPSFEEYKIKVGVLFLADSYAKIDVAFEARTNSEILEDLKSQGLLNPKLIYAVRQKPVNLEVVKCYFDVILKNKV